MQARTDTSGLAELTAHLREVQQRTPGEAKQILKRGAGNIKDDARKRIRGNSYAPAYYRAIGYDVIWHGESGYAEIGPDKDRRQGALGNILEYGTVNNAPRPHLGPALAAEEPRFAEQLEKLGQELLE
jgi:hypothetical protein